MSHDHEWQEDLLRALSDLLRNDEKVKALILSGSLADDTLVADEWSDIDLTAVVSNDAFHDYSTQRSWIESSGQVLGLQRIDRTDRTTLRVCFAPCRRMDLTLVPESVLLNAVPPGDDTRPKCHKVMWSKLPEAEQRIRHLFFIPAFDGVTEGTVVNICEPFCFKAAVAVAKTVRNDLLVAQHLALDLARDCLVLQMLRRDRECGMDIHRIGGYGNDIVSRLTPGTSACPKLGILVLIRRCIEVFDELAADLTPDWRPRAPLMFPGLRRAEAACRGEVLENSDANELGAGRRKAPRLSKSPRFRSR